MTTTPDTSTENVARMIEGVTPGPWSAEPHEDENTAKYFWYVVAGGIIFEVEDIGDDVLATAVGSGKTDRHERNARFIAYAREAVPALAARVAELEAAHEATATKLNGYITYAAEQHDRAEAAEAKLAASEAREAKLQALLKPFAVWARCLPKDAPDKRRIAAHAATVTYGDIRAALEGDKP